MSSNATILSDTRPASQPVETCGTKSEFSETSETNQPQIPPAAKLEPESQTNSACRKKLISLLREFAGQSGRSTHSETQTATCPEPQAHNLPAKQASNLSQDLQLAI